MLIFALLAVLFFLSSCGGSERSNATTSVDALNNWHLRTPVPQDNPLNGVTYGNGTFVAVGGGGVVGETILTSPDGITWTLRTSGDNNILFGVTYGNGTFMAVGTNGTIIQSESVK